MSKAILEDKRVVDIIVSKVIGNEAKDMYVPRSSEWIDGHRADAIYTPIMSLSNSFPPIIIEIQNVVDRHFIHRLQKYCNYIYDSYNNIEPIVLTLCIEMTSTDIGRHFESTNKGSFLKRLPSNYWACEHLIMTPFTIDGCLNHPIDPLLALGYVFMKQKTSLLDLELKDDETVKLVYSITKEIVDRDVCPYEHVTDICSQTQKQFKRILEAINEDGSSSTRVRKYVETGIAYTETCLHKYNRQHLESSSYQLLQRPLYLPEDTSATTGRLDVEVMSYIEPEKKKRDINVAAKFINAYMKDHKRMNWKQCFDEGRANGYYKNYKDSNSLKATYHQLKHKLKE